MTSDIAAPVVALSGPQTIREASETHAALVAALRQPDAVTVDCDEVTAVDLSFVQMLLAARRSAGESGRTLALTRPPQGALLDVLIRGGFLRGDETLPATDPAQWTNDRQAP